mgnify:CR=1 FL=1
MKKTVGRPKMFKETLVISVRFESEDYERVRDIAALETLQSGKLVTANELIRDAVSYVYGDNEKLRECFRRSRASSSSRKHN